MTFKLLAIAFVLWVSMYSINWACTTLYNNKCDIFNIFKKKKIKYSKNIYKRIINFYKIKNVR